MIIDLSHPIRPAMPVYPGTEEPMIEQAFTIEKHGYRENRIRMLSHTGTHMDAPAHMIGEGKKLDAYPVSFFTGKGICLPLHKDCTAIGPAQKELIESLMPDFILFRTGWSRYWGKDEYFRDFPVPDTKSVEWLSINNIRGIGIDTISVDPVGSIDFPNHLQIMKRQQVIIENLTNLDLLPENIFHFSCFPLPLAEADGAPVRAVATI